jgi:hypothetical protein
VKAQAVSKIADHTTDMSVPARTLFNVNFDIQSRLEPYNDIDDVSAGRVCQKNRLPACLLAISTPSRRCESDLE